MQTYLKYVFLLSLAIVLHNAALFSQVSLQFAVTAGAGMDDNCFDTAIDPDGNIYTVGGFNGTMDFDPGVGIYNLTSGGDKDVFVLKVDSNGAFIWAVRFGSTSEDYGFSIAFDTDGNIYVGGRFGLTVDFDPGPLTYNLSGTSFILKMDADANLIWAKSSGGYLWSIDVGVDGSVAATGFYYGPVDFDPGIGVFSLGGSGDEIYIQKLDGDGNFLWAKRIGSSSDDAAQALVIDNLGNVWIYCVFWNTVDFDPGPGIFNLTSNGSSDYGILKLSATGDFQWAGSFGSEASQEYWCIGLATDNSGNIYLGSDFSYTTDMDPGPGVFNKTAGGTDAFVTKLANNGSLLWVKSIDGEEIGQTLAITVDEEGAVYSIGEFSHSADFDPGIGVFNLTAHGDFGNNDIYLQKLDAAGNFVYAISYGSEGHDQARGIAIDNNENIIVTGCFTEVCDFDAGAQMDEQISNGGYDIFIQKLRETNCSDLTIVIDSAQNANCFSPGYAASHAISGIEPYVYSWNSEPVTYDSVAYFPTEGFYDVTVIDANACMKSSKVLISGPGTLSDIDMNANLIYPGFAPGFASTLTVDVYNEGCVPSSGNYYLILDSSLHYTGANPEPEIINGDTLIWYYGNLIYDSLHRVPQVFVTTPADVLIGDTIHLEVQVFAEDDADTTNNSKDYDVQVLGSFDPNNKLAYPDGACAENYITHDQKLTYTIQFQNTGTAEAVNIYILDTLSARLNKNTLRVIASSHDMVTEYLPGDIIKFLFNNIYLPDSNANEPESHGYVIFEIDSKPSAPDGAIIENSAAIYFDFNDPIITNSTTHKLIDEIPVYEFNHLYTMCDGEFVTVGEHVYTEAGIYTDHLISEDGCDSTIITIINILPSYYGIVYATICEGEFYVLGPNHFTVSGDYSVTMDNYVGCDSTVILFLTVSSLDTISNIVEICSGESYNVGDNTYTETGIYEDVLTNILGCDSIIITSLNVHNLYNEVISAEICFGETYSVGGNIYTEAGVYEDVMMDINGCDSTVITDLQVNPLYNETISANICSSETYLFDGTELNESGIYNATFLSISGCDSIVELTLEVQSINDAVITLTNSLTAEITDASYQWVDCNDGFQLLEGETNQTFYPAVSGEYAVIISSGDCIDTSDCYSITILEIGDNFWNNTFKIFPNPATEQITIGNLPLNSDNYLFIYDMAGNVILKSINILSSEIVVDIKDLTSGIYYFQIVNGKEMGTRMFVKK